MAVANVTQLLFALVNFSWNLFCDFILRGEVSFQHGFLAFTNSFVTDFVNAKLSHSRKKPARMVVVWDIQCNSSPPPLPLAVFLARSELFVAALPKSLWKVGLHFSYFARNKSDSRRVLHNMKLGLHFFGIKAIKFCKLIAELATRILHHTLVKKEDQSEGKMGA